MKRIASSDPRGVEFPVFLINFFYHVPTRNVIKYFDDDDGDNDGGMKI